MTYRIFLNLSRKKDKTCLIIDCSQNITDTPGKFRSNAGNDKDQICYFYKKTKDKMYNTIVSERVLEKNKILFQIESALSKRKNVKDETSDENLEQRLNRKQWQ